ncbi:MAG: VanZ family protein [Peptoniphilus sp.]|nr:VanZ family protein [Peptoniphilus sp.]MDY6045101.1 VanZ family protein [Peptoniphilus sp.]
MIRYALKVTPIIAIIAFLSFSLIRTQLFGRYKKKSNRKRERLLLVFATYALWLGFFLLINNEFLESGGVLLGVDTAMDDWQLNLVPFETISLFMRHGSPTAVFLNIWGNILIGIPLGFLTPVLFKRLKKPLPLFVLYGLLFLLIETVQYHIGRSADIDDWLLNMSGVAIGYFLARRQTRFPPTIYRR